MWSCLHKTRCSSPSDGSRVNRLFQSLDENDKTKVWPAPGGLSLGRVFSEELFFPRRGHGFSDLLWVSAHLSYSSVALVLCAVKSSQSRTWAGAPDKCIVSTGWFPQGAAWVVWYHYLVANAFWGVKRSSFISLKQKTNTKKWNICIVLVLRFWSHPTVWCKTSNLFTE